MIAAPRYLLRIPSPIGRLELGGDGRAVVSLSIESRGALPFDAIPEHPDAVLACAATQLAEYFAGTRQRFEVPVQTRGTAFQSAIWDQLSALEWGTVTTYGRLGLGAGLASAGRAVGQAIGANPVPILIPCHRVLGSDGRITGYSAGQGITTKLALLRLEGVLLGGAKEPAA